MIILLTGTRRVGKSTVCQRLVEEGRRRGKRLGGFISPAVFNDRGEKIGADLQDVRTGEARRQYSTEAEKGRAGPQIGPFTMDERVLKWGIHLVEEALRAGDDLVMIDEIGPLELLRGEGFAPLLSTLEDFPTALVLIVVRPELVKALQKRLAGMGHAPIVLFTVTEENRGDLPGELARRLWG
ncbi:MAG: nucleoside-triphosphatase [Anaerolineae bacterium]